VIALVFCAGLFIGGTISFVVVFDYFHRRKVESSCTRFACCCTDAPGRSIDN
jgi:hypothetical protein